MHIQEHVELKKYSTFHIGGAADFFVEVVSKEELREAVMWAEEHGQSWCVVGEGSNILFPDEGVRGLIIKNSILGIVHETTEAGISLTVGAGVILDDLVSYACDHGWWGLENLSSIPGTVGATPVQNVGAYGLEVAEVISSVSVYDSEADSYLVLFPSECRFGYRNSLFKEREGKRYVIHTVSFFLKKETGPCLTYRDLVPLLGAQETLTPHVVRKEVIRIRSQKFPNWHMLGTAGSFFKNPTVSDEAFKELSLKYPGIPGHELPHGDVKVALGWVLDHVCNVRGLRIGDVGTYEAQALVIINYGTATAQEVLTFAEKITECVEKKCDIVIEKEVRIIV